MSAIWITGKTPVSLFIHLVLGLAKSQKNCHEEICSCLKASCCMHLLALGIVLSFVSSWNAALFSAATNLEGESVKMRCFLLFTSWPKNHRFSLITSLRNCHRPGFWQLYSMESCPHPGKPLEKSSWLLLCKEIRAHCYNKWLWTSVFRSVMATAWGISGPWGILKPLPEECGWENGFIPVLTRNGDASERKQLSQQQQEPSSGKGLSSLKGVLSGTAAGELRATPPLLYNVSDQRYECVVPKRW